MMDVAGESQEGTSQLSTTTDTPNFNTAELADPNHMATLYVTPKEDLFVPAFRGRAIRGTIISVPDGYTGVVLIGAAADKTKQASPPPPPGRRPSRRSRRVIHVDEDDEPQDVDMDDVDADGQGERDQLVR